MLERLKSNLSEVRDRIERAAIKSGRSADDVTLVGVTKYVDSATTKMLVDAGCASLGESRPQVLWQKAPFLSDLSIHWHMIGHLQRNKVKRTIPLCSMIHSVDSHRLLQEIDNVSEGVGKQTNVLLEVNVSGESAKHGISPSGLKSTLDFAAGLVNVKVCGLMAMAGFGGDDLQIHRNFCALRELRFNLIPQCPDNVQLSELSMGMSGDFEIAIEEGATLVRIGSLLFDGV